MYESNRLIKDSRATFSNLQLEDRQINTVVIHVGINHNLRDSSQSSIDGLLKNIKNMSLKCEKIGVKNAFISGLVYTTRINIGILDYLR